MILLLDDIATPNDVISSVPHGMLTEDTRVLLELGIGVQTDRTVHTVLLMQDIAEKHGNVAVITSLGLQIISAAS